MKEQEYLYKFMPFNKNALLTILKHELYFASPNILNDPIDCLHNIKIKNYDSLRVEDIIALIETNRTFITWDDQLSNQKIAEDFLKDDQLLLGLIIHLIREKNKDKIGVCSFSREKLDQRLWSHYADSTKGLCLVFNKDLLVNRLELNTDSQVDNFRRFYGDDINYDGQPYEIQIANGDFQLSNEYFFKKTPEWGYEREYRLLLFADAGIKDYSDFEKNRFINYLTEALVGIILGENTTTYELFTMRELRVLSKQNFIIKEIERNITTGKIKLSSYSE
jgi:hypothetical protein